MSKMYDTGTGEYINVDGHIVERDALHIVERIKEYDENLDVMCLDPAKAQFNEAPFVVICWRENGTYYKVFEAWKLDESVVERIYHSDGNRFNPFERITSLEEAKKKLNEDRYRDTAGQSMEIVEAAVRNLKSSFSFKNENGEKVTIHDDKPPVRGDNRSYH